MIPFLEALAATLACILCVEIIDRLTGVSATMGSYAFAMALMARAVAFDRRAA